MPVNIFLIFVDECIIYVFDYYAGKSVYFGSGILSGVLSSWSMPIALPKFRKLDKKKKRDMNSVGLW